MPAQSKEQIFLELSSHFGLPGSERFAKILMKLLNEEEAKILLLLPGTAKDIASKTKISKDKAVEILEDLDRRGFIVPSSGEGEETEYALCANAYDGILYYIGWKRVRGEKLSDSDIEILNLMEDFSINEFLPAYADEAEARVLPVNEAIPTGVEVLPYEEVAKIVDNAKVIAVAPCPCRTMRSLGHGERCPYPLLTCMQFDRAAEIFIKRGIGRKLTKEQALKLLRKFHEIGLFSQIAQADHGFEFICNCCSCCCDYMILWKSLGKGGPFKSRFQAVVDKNLCIGCGICEKRCHFGAPEVKDGVSHIDPDRCMGCGLCVITCPTEAIKLVPVRGKEHIPEKAGWSLIPPLPSYDELKKQIEAGTVVWEEVSEGSEQS